MAVGDFGAEGLAFPLRERVLGGPEQLALLPADVIVEGLPELAQRRATVFGRSRVPHPRRQPVHRQVIAVQPLDQGVVEGAVANEPRQQALALGMEVRQQAPRPEAEQLRVERLDLLRVGGGQLPLQPQREDEAVVVLLRERRQPRFPSHRPTVRRPVPKGGRAVPSGGRPAAAGGAAWRPPVLQRLPGTPSIAHPSRLFYGWWIVGAGLVLNALMGALVMHAYGAYVAVFRTEFGWSSAMLALGYASIQGTNGVVGPGQGWLTDRFGPRAVIRVGLVVLAVGLLLFSQISQLGHFFPALFVIAVGMSLGGFLSVMVAIVHWFERYRATAISFITGGFGLGGVLAFLVVLAIDAFGWEITAIGSAVAVLAFGLPAAQLIRTRPEDHGYRVDGAPAPERAADDPAAVAEIPRKDEGFTVGEALRTRQFWFISIGHGSALLVVSAVMVHLVTHLTESLGYSLPQAGAIQSVIPIAMVVGTLSGGILGDRVNKRALGAGSMVLAGVAILVLVVANALWMIFVFALLHGLAWGVRGPVLLALRADYFGARDFGKIMGLSQLVMTSGMMTGPLFAGLMRDRTGGFEEGFTILSVIALAGALLIVFSPRPRRPLAGAS